MHQKLKVPGNKSNERSVNSLKISVTLLRKIKQGLIKWLYIMFYGQKTQNFKDLKFFLLT